MFPFFIHDKSFKSRENFNTDKEPRFNMTGWNKSVKILKITFVAYADVI